MSWVTIIWSMIAASCLTLGAIYCLVWYRNRASWAHLLFSLSAFSTAAFAFFELWMMRAETPAEFLLATKWAQVPIFTWLLSILWFVRIYLGTGRTWLAWTISVVRTIYLVIGLFFVPHILYRELSIQHMQFLGESVTVAHGVTQPLVHHRTVVRGADARVPCGCHHHRLATRRPAKGRDGRWKCWILPAHGHSHDHTGGVGYRGSATCPQPSLYGHDCRDGIRVEPRRAPRVGARRRPSKEQSTDFGPHRSADCGAGVRTDPNRPRSSR